MFPVAGIAIGGPAGIWSAPNPRVPRIGGGLSPSIGTGPMFMFAPKGCVIITCDEPVGGFDRCAGRGS